MAFTLSAVETRILGCLLEKERLTPENYPLSLHALALACNQTSSRDPITRYDEKSLEDELFELRQKKLVSQVMTTGARVPKYRHLLGEHLELSEAEVALLCVLMLRGPQTTGELRTRTERQHHFDSAAEVEDCLKALAEGDDPLVRGIPARPGQKEQRYVQLLSGTPDLTDYSSATPSPVTEAAPSRLTLLQEEVQQLREELGALREEFRTFKQQFE
ncbi:MAG: YceH family protein [Verrucomicrobiales bacterium]|nr:YceH family protein [Verrucomicrobiales bacterium]